MGELLRRLRIENILDERRPIIPPRPTSAPMPAHGILWAERRSAGGR